MAQAAVTILKGFENTSLTNDKAEDLMEWMSDLARESIENDTSLKEVRFPLENLVAVRHLFGHISKCAIK